MQAHANSPDPGPGSNVAKGFQRANQTVFVVFLTESASKILELSAGNRL